MRVGSAIGLSFLLAGTLYAQAPKEQPSTDRYGVHLRLRTCPQGTPKEALESALATIDNGQFDYLLAQLVDPDFVDKRVKDVYGGKFEELVQETTDKLDNDPIAVKELRRFFKEGEWDIADTTATVKLKDVKDRQVYLKKMGTRWYWENRQKPEAAKPEP
jgi:hypothetical protein